MASAEDSMNPQHQNQQQALQAQQFHLMAQQQSASSNVPPYPEMIVAAIEALNEPAGSSKAAISKHMESAHSDLPPAHPTLLSHHLNEMKEAGQVAMVRNNYVKPDPNPPPKRGRGRPPKPKDPLPTGAVLSPPRPRGRPPKPRDPFAPPAPSVKKSSGGGSGRPRGRPPKKAKTGPSPAPGQAAGAPRGRGRPPKVKPAVAPVAG